MNPQPSTALEQCTSCQTSPNKAASDNQELQPVAYDEGNGIKDKIVMTGPLSEILTQAMNIVFEKKPLELTDNPPEADTPTMDKPAASSESYAQDHFMEQLVNEVGKAPELQVVLSDFDVQSVDDHIADTKAGTLPTESPDVTTVLVTNASEIVKPENYEALVGTDTDFRGIVLVVGDMGGPGPVQPPEETAMLLFEDHAETERCLERLFEGTGAKICFGMEAFTQELKNRQAAKRKAGA
jgi:hypothetical protein